MKIINCRVLPRSSRDEVVGEMADGTLKIKLASAPVDNKANESLIEILADYFQVSKSKIKIIRGRTNKNKIVEIMD